MARLYFMAWFRASSNQFKDLEFKCISCIGLRTQWYNFLKENVTNRYTCYQDSYGECTGIVTRHEESCKELRRRKHGSSEVLRALNNVMLLALKSVSCLVCL